MCFMAKARRFELPKDVADQLLKEKLAVPALNTRSAGAGQVLAIMIHGVSTGADFATVAIAGAALRRFAAKMPELVRSWAGKEAAESVQFVIRSGSEEHVFELGPDVTADEATEQFASMLQKAGVEIPTS